MVSDIDESTIVPLAQLKIHAGHFLQSLGGGTGAKNEVLQPAFFVSEHMPGLIWRLSQLSPCLVQLLLQILSFVHWS